MEHHFNVNIATEYGLLEAILLNNIYFWVEHNRANETHFYDGEYWTYNSVKAFGKLFPYVSERQIGTALKNLIDNNILKTGNYNANPYDRTKWYALTKMGYSIMQKCQMKNAEMSNGNVDNVEPIPYNKPNIKTHIETPLAETNVSTAIPQPKVNTYESIEEGIQQNAVIDDVPPPPQTPPPPSQHNILDKVEKKTRRTKTKAEKREDWIKNCLKTADQFGFTDSVTATLETYFGYLFDSNVQYPQIVIQLQLQRLSDEVPTDKQSEVLTATMRRGWKSVEYVLDQRNKETRENTPSYRLNNSSNNYSVEENQAWYDEMKRRAEEKNEL